MARRKDLKAEPDLSLTALSLERIYAIHDRLKRMERVRCKDLAEELGVSERSVMRDIAFLRDRFKAPIPPPPLPDGYYYTERFELAGEVALTEGELLAFMVAQRMVDELGSQSSYSRALRQGMERISRRLARKLPVKLEDLVHRSYSIDLGPLREVAPEVQHAVDRALQRRSPLEITYRALAGDGELTRRVVEPYILKNHRGDWYVVGLCRLRKGLRTFALSRIQRCQVLEDETFQVPEDFDVESYFRNALALFTGQKAERCTVWFSARASRWILERRWHATQEVETLPGGDILLHMEVAPSLEVVRWILAHGEEARAVAPPDLVREVADQVRKMYEQLKDGEPGPPGP